MSWTDGCPFNVRLSKTDDVRPQNPHAVRFSVNLLELRAIATDFRRWPYPVASGSESITFSLLRRLGQLLRHRDGCETPLAYGDALRQGA
jgi:hypothetical protein